MCVLCRCVDAYVYYWLVRYNTELHLKTYFKNLSLTKSRYNSIVRSFLCNVLNIKKSNFDQIVDLSELKPKPLAHHNDFLHPSVDRVIMQGKEQHKAVQNELVYL